MHGLRVAHPIIGKSRHYGYLSGSFHSIDALMCGQSISSATAFAPENALRTSVVSA